MATKRKLDSLTLMEAVDHLSDLAELDILGERAAIDKSELLHWVDPKLQEENKQVVSSTFRTLHHYLDQIDKSRLVDPETQKGIQAMMLLAGEAAQKVDKYTTLFKGIHATGTVTNSSEYKELQQLYLSKVVKKQHEKPPAQERWQKDLESIASDHVDSEGLKGMEAVRRDREYELFCIRKEDGRPFFNRNLLRHILWVGDFDETLSGVKAESPFFKIAQIKDKQLHASAKEILAIIAPHLSEFYKEAMQHKSREFVASLNKAVMALMLAANPRNLIQNTTGKPCLKYYEDFHGFLREALESKEYHRLISHPMDISKSFQHSLINLTHALCSSFFLRVAPRKEALYFIHQLMEKTTPAPLKKQSIWLTFIEDNEQIKTYLKHYPNGPLLKTLELLRQEEFKEGFDPLSQGHLPEQLFTMSYEDAHISIISLASPTIQQTIDRVEIAEEFKGFLHSLAAGQKHLLINMQDRTSWKEHARCEVIEQMQHQKEFSEHLITITLAKHTDFYHQTASYQHLNAADQFIRQFKEQLASKEQCGFYFPASLEGNEFADFIDEAMRVIHKHFFASLKELSRKERLDFIEIFYQLFALKCIHWVQPDSLSFTDKDTVDTAAAATGGFFAFYQMVGAGLHDKEEMDFLRWMFFSPALFTRERTIDSVQLQRMISCLDHIFSSLNANKPELLSALQKLYSKEQLAALIAYKI